MNVTELIERLRKWHNDTGAPSYRDAADALEAQAREIERLKQELGWPTETERRLADADANAPWLTQAHMICTDHGIPQGNISDRLEMLAGYLAESERDAARYRWLRTSNWLASYGWPESKLDAAIDAAMEGVE